MNPPSEATERLAVRLMSDLAASSLPPQLAKLYSHHTRLSNRQEGLATWSDSERLQRLDDAVHLLEAGLILREGGQARHRDCLRRAAEILEWLAHPNTNPDNLPIRLLAGALYQLAGYSARSSGLLNEDDTSQPESPILRAFLRADFPTLLERLCDYWLKKREMARVGTGTGEDEVEPITGRIESLIVEETASCLGVFCAAMRWGEERRLEKSLDRMQRITGLMNYGGSPYSWLLAKLCTQVAFEYLEFCLWRRLAPLRNQMNPDGRAATDRYNRLAYRDRKAIAWPSQAAGIEKLAQGRSFTLCTPTGSGKTTVAELAILQSLFAPTPDESGFDKGGTAAPLALYLVPSRALAAEVEAKLSKVLRRLSEEPVVVTGLYGGTDWGPTDAWLTNSERTVLICTYEKSEALMRFLGPLFLDRVRLIVVDEAHMVEFDGQRDTLRKAENRGLRLESLGMRLFSHVEGRDCNVIALSAVATGMDRALAGWVSGDGSQDRLLRSSYRSTRQLVGRLECLANRGFEIHYDLMDGADLQFERARGPADSPFIRSPFPAFPIVRDWPTGPNKILRPYLLWAAMNLAAPDDRGQRHGVLISITERIGGYAGDFLELLEGVWSGATLPSFFEVPEDLPKRKLWDRCLRACGDYFGRESPESRLLERGIVIHYGRMPGLMARLLIEVIDQKIVHLVMATSTLSEGINLPFETILIPSLSRWDAEQNQPRDLSAREFGNLVGRAGRPGVGTEGRALVLLMGERRDYAHSQARQSYLRLIRELSVQSGTAQPAPVTSSPLAELLRAIWEQWKRLEGIDDPHAFYRWLEVTAPLGYDPDEGRVPEAVSSLDTLDSIIISALVEIEQLAREVLSDNDLEERLQRIWQRSYARYAAEEHEVLGSIFLNRGHALLSSIYPDRGQRRRLYRTCLSPRAGMELIDHYHEVRDALKEGIAYANWGLQEQLAYVTRIVTLVGTIRKFRYDAKARTQPVDIEDVLAWWLLPASLRNVVPRGTRRKIPNQKQVSEWVRYINSNLIYRFAWGVGSILALAVDEVHGGELKPTRIEEWPDTGLPWIAFWLKEIVTWGT